MLEIVGLLGLLVVGLSIISYGILRRVAKPRLNKVRHGLVYARWPWNSCKARIKKGTGPFRDATYYGRCELIKGHYTDFGTGEEHHCLERGMVLVRWNSAGDVRYEQS